MENDNLSMSKHPEYLLIKDLKGNIIEKIFPYKKIALQNIWNESNRKLITPHEAYYIYNDIVICYENICLDCPKDPYIERIINDNGLDSCPLINVSGW